MICRTDNLTDSFLSYYDYYNLGIALLPTVLSKKGGDGDGEGGDGGDGGGGSPINPFIILGIYFPSFLSYSRQRILHSFFISFPQ